MKLFQLASATIISLIPLMSTADQPNIGKEFGTCYSEMCGSGIARKERLTDLPLSGEAVIGEPIFVSEDMPNEYKTSFTPESVISVYSKSRGIKYESGVDFSLTPEGIYVPNGSRIAKAPHGFASPKTEEDINLGVKKSYEYEKYQIQIDYKKKDRYNIIKTGHISNVWEKYKDRKVSITFFGDSISYGSDTKYGYVNLVMSEIDATHKGKYVFRNNSYPGISSLNASWWKETSLKDKRSDIIILSFGMNDSNNVTPEKYKENIEKVISSVREKYPKTEFVLLSPIRPNPNSKIHQHDYFDKYRHALNSIALSHENVVSVDLTSAWDRIMKNKTFYDYTTNGLHHPNDYVHKVMAEAVLESI